MSSESNGLEGKDIEYIKGVEAFGKGCYDDAASMFGRALEGGKIEAALGMAHVCLEKGDTSGAVKYLEIIERSAREGNGDAAYVAYTALNFDFRGVGGIGRENSQLEFLKMAAASGNSYAQLDLADFYRRGRVTGKVDSENYETWIKLAMEQGLDEAVCFYAENQIDAGFAPNPELLRKVKNVRSDLKKRAEKILRASKK